MLFLPVIKDEVNIFNVVYKDRRFVTFSEGVSNEL